MPMGALGWTALIVAWAMVLVLGIVLVRGAAAARRRGRRSDLELLELRFAAGEITRRELEERTRLLGVDPHIPLRFTKI